MCEREGETACEGEILKGMLTCFHVNIGTPWIRNRQLWLSKGSKSINASVWSHISITSQHMPASFIIYYSVSMSLLSSNILSSIPVTGIAQCLVSLLNVPPVTSSPLVRDRQCVTLLTRQREKLGAGGGDEGPPLLEYFKREWSSTWPYHLSSSSDPPF